MFELSRFTDLRPLLNHFILHVDRHYLCAEVLFKGDRDLDALHKWLVRHSSKKQREKVSENVKLSKLQTLKCRSLLEEQST